MLLLSDWVDSRVQAIAHGTKGAVAVVEGWGGMYMLELIDAGICGVMPVPTSQPRNLPVPYAVSAASRSGFNPKVCSVRSIIILVAATSS